ncbi:membrane-bound metal-dependent hydrolase [Natrialba hulunbeirensis JCM 10989]|uniref:Membrane-bound metal-dependent hydrolase n=1 Tax=Natrialba hulunbeirensis JCM 10989 TaxID=1227493 RepID=M0AEK6_9EURY|nr:metal-dependent hydrolase [Natrialba hulunbeirensis]ELY95773.1 membrane-bound metal-dependent hydrolase [Natrialba hulunbeirensis JCM 10989]
MAELLSHVLIAYVLFTVASWRLEWLTKRWVAIGMIGALLPDLNRIGMFVDDATIETTLGVPFGIDALHTLGGVILLSGIGALVLTEAHKRGFGVLLAGALTHLLTDGLKAYADAEAGAWLYPFTWYRHPTPNLYVSADQGVVLVTGLLAIAIFLVDYRLTATPSATDP